MKAADLKWKRVTAGTRFPADALVVYDYDPDPRLSRCAIYDGWYLLVGDLQQAIPKDDK